MESNSLEKSNMSDELNPQGTTFILCDDAERDHGYQPYVDGPFARSQFDLPDGPLLRFQAYRKAWDKCLCRIKEILHTLYDPAVDAVLESVQTAYADSGGQVVLPSSELVTLVVSSSDRINLYEVLARISSTLCGEQEQDVASQDGIESDWAPGTFISRLSELDCTNVTMTMKSLIGGFTSQPLGNSISAKMKPSASLAAYDMTVLKAWYQVVKEKYGSSVPALVVLIHDLHSIDPGILRDVLEICSLYVPHIPLVFILGTSDPEILHSTLPRSTLARLRVDKHVLPWNVKALEHLVRETFFSVKFTPDVMVGPIGLEMIFREFKRQNATLDAVLSTLQLLHLQHFYNPLSIVVDPASEALLCDIDDRPQEGWMPWFKLLRQYCIPTLFGAKNETEPSEWSEIMPHDVIQTVLDARTTFRARMNRTKLALSVLETVLAFARSHDRKSSTMPFEKLGIEALRGSLGGTDARGIPDIMRQLSLNETAALLEELYHLLHNLPSRVRNDAFALKAKVVLVKNTMTQEEVADFVDFLGSYFEETLIPFEDIPCLDIWWTGEITIPHSPLNPNPRISILTALLEPEEYLGWSTPAKSPQSGEISSLPDTCILFRRYVESGKLINVYDWYDSFSVALEDQGFNRDDDHTMHVDESPSKGKGKGKGNAEAILKRKQQDDEEEEEPGGVRKREIQARFMRSIHELEFVGFLRHTGRKADHVVKTAFDILD